MSVSSRGTKSIQHDEEVTHVVCLEETPSPPPKPPRGVFRKGAPMKPQRSALRIEPLQNDEKENSQPTSQFKARDTMAEMMSYFERSIAVLRRSEEFTGTEAADVLTAYIESNRSKFLAENVGRANAIKLLEIWRTQNFIHCVDPNQKKFVDSDRAFYRLGVEIEQNLYVAPSPTPSRAFDDASAVSRSSSTRRNNSFKRLFSPLVRRNRSNSRGRDKENTKDAKDSTTARSTWSLFSSSTKQDKKARRAEQQLIKEEEAEVYELALFHLLRLIEVEFLEDVALPVQDAKKNASFLSSILEKVGLGAGEDCLDMNQEDEMDLLIETHPLIRDARHWFQMARCCAPMLYLEKSPEKSQKMQLFLWCKQALTAVAARLEKMTQNGESPLFPNEFSPLLTKIAQQLINDVNAEEKLNTAVMYIFLMVPHPLRTTIDQIVQWLQLTMRTDAVEDLRSPYYLGRKEPRHKENYKVIVEELRPFIFPKKCMSNFQQDLFVETLVNLRSNNLLGVRPEELENSIRAKHSSAGEDLTPIRFTVPRESLREKAVQKNKEGLSTTELALVQMIEAMLDDKKTSLTEKKKQLSNFQKCHPALYKRFFKDLI